MAESRPSSEDGSKQPEGCQMHGRAPRPQNDPSSQQVALPLVKRSKQLPSEKKDVCKKV